jgi:hypothetical protein
MDTTNIDPEHCKGEFFDWLVAVAVAFICKNISWPGAETKHRDKWNALLTPSSSHSIMRWLLESANHKNAGADGQAAIND